MAKREKTMPATISRMASNFKNFKPHSDQLSVFFEDSEPSNRVKADSDGTSNKADVAFKQLVEGNVMPNRRNGGVKEQKNRRNK